MAKNQSVRYYDSAGSRAFDALNSCCWSASRWSRCCR